MRQDGSRMRALTGSKSGLWSTRARITSDELRRRIIPSEGLAWTASPFPFNAVRWPAKRRPQTHRGRVPPHDEAATALDFSCRNGVVLAFAPATLPRARQKHSLGGHVMTTTRHCLLAAAAAALAFGFAASYGAGGGSLLDQIDARLPTARSCRRRSPTPKRTGPSNPNCVGENVSPQLSWSNVPDGTKSFVLLMTDPEGRGGAGVNHWVAYGIPGIRDRFRRRRNQQGLRQICRRQEHAGRRLLFRPVHAARPDPASLYIRARRHRFRSARNGAGPDARRSAGRSWQRPAHRPRIPKASPAWSACSSIRGMNEFPTKVSVAAVERAGH